MNSMEILNSNLLQTVIIFLTGSIALIIYFANKISEKKDAARIILNEIRLAEKAIIEIKNNKAITELSIILPNNTWQFKKHFFLKDLDQDELNLINDFYYKCTYAEQYRNIFYDIRNNSISIKASYLQQKLIDIMHEAFINNKGEDYYAKAKDFLIKNANEEDFIFIANTPRNNIILYIENIIMITPTNAGRILKKIAK
ncbi:MAG: hypothetical protein LBQ88_21375 [Treponema sp.]|nr:hypothetical protein [Treponema sp.]